MPKLLEQNAAEMAGTLVAISAPVRSFVEDQEFMDALTAAIRKGAKTKLHAAALFFADMTPQLLGDKHLKDTIAILAAIEGESPKNMLKKNGTEVLKDAMKAWDEQLKDFFLQLGITV